MRSKRSLRAQKENDIFKVAPLEQFTDRNKGTILNTEMAGPNTIRTQHESNVTVGSQRDENAMVMSSVSVTNEMGIMSQTNENVLSY